MILQLSSRIWRRDFLCDIKNLEEELGAAGQRCRRDDEQPVDQPLQSPGRGPEVENNRANRRLGEPAGMSMPTTGEHSR